jgi:pimeloyl-ACP methyl ester carboxylesterase
LSIRDVKVRDRTVSVHEAGQGAPLVYLHGIADLHGITAEPQPFHHALAKDRRVIAPAHPGCAGSDEDGTLESMEDLVFHYLELFDALGLDRIDLAGACIGGWLAAEIAVRHPERVNRLALIGATGLFVSGKPIGDLFMAVQPRDGTLADLRTMLFRDGEGPLARALFPDDGGDRQAGLLKYKAFRFAARIGFQPPYFHHRKLRDRLYRHRAPSLVLHGAEDAMVPCAHAEAYASGLGDARLAVVPGCGHSLHLEDPAFTAGQIRTFLAS